MHTEHRERQTADRPVILSGWRPDENFPVFPVGSKPKRLLVCPDATDHPFLIPRHRYLFKVAQGWQAYQSWSEIVAYELARPLKLEVPPCFIAIDESTGETGVLVEFFYGYPDDPAPPRFVHGSDLLQRVVPTAYDQKTGRPHYLKLDLALCRTLGVKDATAWWGRTLAFDTLIGNTDRHPENWGLMVRRPTPGNTETALAPIFDNGTSLGYEIRNEAFAAWSAERLNRYVARGTHHCGWDLTDKGKPHVQLCADYRKGFPAASTPMKNVILLDDSQIEEVTQWCTGFEVPLRFSAERAQFVNRLVKTRRDQLAQALGA